jgi:hypothetical protein
VKQIDPQVRAALVARLREKQAAGQSITADVRRAAAASLQQQGLAQRHPSAGYLELTDDVRDALLLDEPE